MEKIRFKDGSVVEAERNGSCFIVDEKPLFPKNLDDITIDGETSAIISHGKIIECASIDGRYWFTITEVPPEELEKVALLKKLDDAESAVAELSELVAAMI